MSGWIKLEKDLREDPRVKRMARSVAERFSVTNGNAPALVPVYAAAFSLVLGGLCQVWMHADGFARPDDTIDLTTGEIDELVGIPGFCNLMPPEWLEVLSDGRVKLPAFQEHNGAKAKSLAQGAERSRRHREAHKSDAPPRSPVTARNAAPLADQTRLDHTRPDQGERERSQARAPRAERRVPEGWRPDGALALALRGECPGVDLDRELRKFLDHTFDRGITDWAAAFRNWVRKAEDFAKRDTRTRTGLEGLSWKPPEESHG